MAGALQGFGAARSEIGIEKWLVIRLSRYGTTLLFTVLNEDYKEMLQSLIDEQVKLLLVGTCAMAAHGYPRATMDIDTWVMPSPENADAVLRALKQFGVPLQYLAYAEALERLKCSGEGRP